MCSASGSASTVIAMSEASPSRLALRLAAIPPRVSVAADGLGCLRTGDEVVELRHGGDTPLDGLQGAGIAPGLAGFVRHEAHDHREAIDDNAETAALLGQLDGMSKSSPEFIDKVTQLRHIFQQHIRDDRKELWQRKWRMRWRSLMRPNSRRRQTREQVEVVQRMSDGVTETLQASVDNAQTVTRVMQEAMQTSFGTLTELAHRSIGQTLNLTNRSEGDARPVSEETADNFWAVAQSGNALARGLQDVSREVVDRSQKRFRRNLEGLQALVQCRSITDLFEVQSSLRDNLEHTIENSRQIAELTIQMAVEATQTVTVQAQKTVQRFEWAA